MPSLLSSSTMRCPRRTLLSPLHRLAAVLAVLAVLGAILSGCASGPSTTTSATGATSPTATLAATATPTPRPFTSFTCAPGSLPLGSGLTQVHCIVAPDGAYTILHASYTGGGTNGPVDDPRLTADGWLMVDQAHGDSPNGAIGHALYFHQSAWFAVEYSYPSATMSLEQGIPMSGVAPVPCGQTLSPGSSQIQGVPLPTSLVSTKAGAYRFAPACLQDILHFYPSALATAGWTLIQPFQAPPGSVAGSPVTAVMAVVMRGSTTLEVWLAGGDGTPTMIAVHPSPPM